MATIELSKFYVMHIQTLVRECLNLVLWMILAMSEINKRCSIQSLNLMLMNMVRLLTMTSITSHQSSTITYQCLTGPSMHSTYRQLVPACSHHRVFSYHHPSFIIIKCCNVSWTLMVSTVIYQLTTDAIQYWRRNHQLVILVLSIISFIVASDGGFILHEQMTTIYYLWWCISSITMDRRVLMLDSCQFSFMFVSTRCKHIPSKSICENQLSIWYADAIVLL